MDINLIDALEQSLAEYFCRIWVSPFDYSKKIRHMWFASNNGRVHKMEFSLREIQQIKQLLLDGKLDYRKSQVDDNFITPNIDGITLKDIWDKVDFLRSNFKKRNSAKSLKNFHSIINEILELDNNFSFFDETLKQKVKAKKAVNSRYKKSLYPSQKIICDVLIAESKKNGKWDNLNQAVTSSIDLIKLKLKEFHITWVLQEIDRLKNELKSLEQNKLLNDQYRNDPEYFGVVRQNRAYINKINKIRQELEFFEAVRSSKDPSYELGKKVPYNTIYIDESIINFLRRHGDILKLIIKGDN